MKTYLMVAERIPQNSLAIDCRRPQKLYRYSNAKWLERSLELGEFRLRAATDYGKLVTDTARNDDELVRIQSTDGRRVEIKQIETGEDIIPIGTVTYRSEIHTDYLALFFSTICDPRLFNEFSDSNACLVIHEVDEFCERIHAAAEVQLPGWVGIDGAATYGGQSPLGAIFAKPLRFLQQHEWRFAWVPVEPMRNLEPVFLKIGNIEAIAEIRFKTE